MKNRMKPSGYIRPVIDNKTRENPERAKYTRNNGISFSFRPLAFFIGYIFGLLLGLVLVKLLT